MAKQLLNVVVLFLKGVNKIATGIFCVWVMFCYQYTQWLITITTILKSV
jgi:hypothetical protein